MTRPDLAILIGAMKAGTTTLFERLSRHPGIAPSSKKEPNFFGNDERWARGPGWYRSLFADDLEGRVMFEASTSYTKRPVVPHAAKRLHHYARERDLEVRLVYSLRDPLTRMRSQVTQVLTGRGFTRPFETFKDGSISGYALFPSMYAFQLEPFIDRFGRENIHLIDFDRMHEDLEAVLAEILAFLDLPAEDLPDGETVHNPSAGKYRKSWLWDRFEDLRLDALTDYVPEPVMERVRGVLGDAVEDHVELTPDQTAAALHALETDLRTLRDELGFEVDGWTLPPSMREH